MANKFSILKRESEITKILFMYRYISLLITSLFYILGNSIHTIEKKVLIVAVITLSSFLLHYLYIKNQNIISNIKILVLIETVGNSFLLIPSGGLTSPYVWYSLNTILVSSVMLNKKYSWIILSFYFFNSTLVTYLVMDNKEGFLTLLRNESNLILSFILITGVIQLLSKYAMKLEHKSRLLIEANQELEKANLKIKESIIHIVGMYQAVHLMTNQQSRDDLTNIVLEYTHKITGAENVILIQSINNEKLIRIEGKGIGPYAQDEIKKEITMNWRSFLYQDLPLEIRVKDSVFWLLSIRSNSKMYGVLGIEIRNEDLKVEEIKDQLSFLVNLSGVVLEKFELEQMNEQLLINEEQNRIANEIHDGVLQKLFSISLGIYALIKNLKEERYSGIKTDLNNIRESLNSAMKDLRSTIYGLSWKKEGINNFLAGIQAHIDEIKALNKVNILFNFNGKDELLSTDLKKAIYRIITEGIGNAVRHGNAKIINVNLSVDIHKAVLIIMDDGKGFRFEKLKSETTGLGLGNIQSLTDSFQGSLEIDSKIGEGTQINIIIPMSKNVYEEEAV